MLKKIIITTVLGVYALNVIAANAIVPGMYFTVQLGNANTHMASKTDLGAIQDKFTLDSPNLSNNSLTGRFAIGYQFNQHFALEMGYLPLRKKELHSTIKAYMQDVPVNFSLSAALKQDVIDLTGKRIVPIFDKFNLYAKLGVAYVTSCININKKIVNLKNGSAQTSELPSPIAKHTWAPEAALGASYDITPNISVDASWMHIQPLGKNRPGNIDFVGVGVGYNVG
ncbi:OmpA-like transmembrane domain protein [Candidatus Rickettsiella viridis]|uniref:OmpA-like transmembrane domain protein n=1 Tax=Candidatus Rickettsiella viridis TaxID=676208 RepID=A0A2Z5V774_9COXI|nr:outer membrane beta-barrel protein [Candidatus Rickettsiella viridis]BBB15227.1 OmpA-like transmembrane domain protein [Candidatus Rickettsiella viridis]